MDSVNHNSDSLKLCKRCNRPLPATSEFFSINKTYKDGLAGICKPCNAAKTREYHQRHKEQVKAYVKQYQQNNPEKTRAYKRTYDVKNQDKVRQIKLDYRANNPEKDRQSKRKYQKEHREELTVKHQQYRAKHVEEIKAYDQQYRQTERGKISLRARSHNRRARKKNAAGKHTTEELRQLILKQEGKCYYCHAQLGNGRNAWHADHYIPISRGGSNDISNIRIAC